MALFVVMDSAYTKRWSTLLTFQQTSVNACVNSLCLQDVLTYIHVNEHSKKNKNLTVFFIVASFTNDNLVDHESH